jgi:XTP/dITP diphosphohydrolase
MSRELLFATQNPNKLKEISALLEGKFHLISLAGLGFHDDIPETAETLNENALLKARFVYQRFGRDCFADDTGLEVKSLNGEPGVYSARYAGPQRNDQDNMRLLLHKLQQQSDRSARFRTVIALIMDGKEFLFEGSIEGHILTEPVGSNGFGYDPVFCPEGSSQSFAQMSLEEKNRLSHRARAFQKMRDFLLGL